MSEPLTSARFALPYLAVAQAQKEVIHNEALVLIDALVQPVVVDGPLPDVPTTPVVGQCWLVGSDATGAWSMQDGRMAIWTSGGWRFANAVAGMRVVRQADGNILRFDGFDWIGPPEIAEPTGGSTIDAESRTAIAALLAALSAQGWLDSP